MNFLKYVIPLGIIAAAIFSNPNINKKNSRKNRKTRNRKTRNRKTRNRKTKNQQGGQKEHFSNLKNIYGDTLQSCRKMPSDMNGSWDSQGLCSEKGGGVHQICFDVTDDTADFSMSTGQSDWSKTRVNKNHCMCLGAWALYKAKNKGNNNELVCDAIPEMALSKEYINNWNTWNGNELPNQIINGVDSLVKQCYTKQKDKKKKEFLKTKYDQLRKSYKNSKWNSIIQIR